MLKGRKSLKESELKTLMCNLELSGYTVEDLFEQGLIAYSRLKYLTQTPMDYVNLLYKIINSYTNIAPFRCMPITTINDLIEKTEHYSGKFRLNKAYDGFERSKEYYIALKAIIILQDYNSVQLNAILQEPLNLLLPFHAIPHHFLSPTLPLQMQ